MKTIRYVCDDFKERVTGWSETDLDRRDLFAAFALAGMLASGEAIKTGTFAEMAYIYADSMEEARETK